MQNLQIAWTIGSGEIPGDDNKYWGGSSIQSNPIFIDGVLYSTTPTLHVFFADLKAEGYKTVDCLSQ